MIKFNSNIEANTSSDDIINIGIVDESEQKSVEKSVEKIIREIRENPQITVRELTTLVGLSRRGVEKNIKKLQEQGIIRRVGPDKGGHWEIIKEKS